MTKTLALIAAGAGLALSAGCVGSGGNDRGINDYAQDEFRVVTKPPLTVPPDYSLRPPPAGSSQPAEVAADPTITAFGTNIGENASAAERALVSAAGANAVSPVIRSRLDFEEAAMIRKSPSLADRILFWQDDEDAAERAASDGATGGGEVTIERSTSAGGFKLPGT